MSDNVENITGGCVGIAFSIVAWLWPAWLAWSWVEPDSFLGFLGFLVVWAFVGYLTDFILGLLLVIVAKMFDD